MSEDQRYAKALDTFASSAILQLIGEAESLAMSGNIDQAFDILDFANGRLPNNVRLAKDGKEYSPSAQLTKALEDVISIDDYRLKDKEYMSYSDENLRRAYFAEIQQYKLQLFKEIKKQLTDKMQAHNMYFQETRRYHKEDAPVSEI